MLIDNLTNEAAIYDEFIASLRSLLNYEFGNLLLDLPDTVTFCLMASSESIIVKGMTATGNLCHFCHPKIDWDAAKISARLQEIGGVKKMLKKHLGAVSLA